MTVELELQDDVLKAALAEAQRRGTDVSQVIEGCLRESNINLLR